ncbi:hypothetical protein B0H10DRAFT_2095176, partial [Mycena sp. CBHHK59/15]
SEKLEDARSSRRCRGRLEGHTPSPATLHLECGCPPLPLLQRHLPSHLSSSAAPPPLYRIGFLFRRRTAQHAYESHRGGASQRKRRGTQVRRLLRLRLAFGLRLRLAFSRMPRKWVKSSQTLATCRRAPYRDINAADAYVVPRPFLSPHLHPAHGAVTVLRRRPPRSSRSPPVRSNAGSGGRSHRLRRIVVLIKVDCSEDEHGEEMGELKGGRADPCA